MKMRKAQAIKCCVIFAILLLIGCESNSGSPKIPASSVSAVPTNTPTSAPMIAIKTIIPKQTSMPLTLTPNPTLTAEQVRAFVVSSLQDPQRCNLPCWWYIIPGEATWETARNSFIQQGLRWLESGNQGGIAISISYPDLSSPFTYRVDVDFIAKNGLVQSITIKGEEVFSSDHFAEDWKGYSIKSILDQYGSPTEVLVSVNAPHEPGASFFYRLYMFYQQQGFGISYGGIANESGSSVHVCPTLEQSSNIQLWLQPPTSGASLDKLAISSDERPFIQSLEKATSMSLSAFYKIFKDDNQQQCFDTPASIWP